MCDVSNCNKGKENKLHRASVFLFWFVSAYWLFKSNDKNLTTSIGIRKTSYFWIFPNQKGELRNRILFLAYPHEEKHFH